MRMNDEWAKELKEIGVKIKEESDPVGFYRLTFYVPNEKPGVIVIREHTDADMDMVGYKSRRIGEMSFEEFDNLPFFDRRHFWYEIKL